ncbi:HisH1 [Desulforapulum autotrophicum HRM2]|jgi:glutamine amidotransferase|uniref:Imidazole glycerol phosphate synthase subunit HisH n=1 Tax=Desulforapulum autotrophicum (strain ATCC 43914 / DSM 3382 / VKM B-1955 / HRM2) TaxID=177437 RepID=C0Q9D4_DESAH|nr:imidazole glycerol phosphate synthase subunit HisH [Desulforapulum autotrophicum]ACN16639.1 HisH1 [Desulforapulum autotrophicum HRM2]
MITIVDYGGGNLTSVARAVSFLGFTPCITGDADEIRTADRIIFPGVGAAGAAMTAMEQGGIDLAMKEAFNAGVPMLGICVGCQIIMDQSQENDAVCLGLIPGEVRAFPQRMPSPEGGRLKVPHMGWNGLTVIRDHPLLQGVKKDDEFYFVHSYFPVPKDEGAVFGTTDYGVSFTSALGMDNLFATQFHLEKSGEPGLLILKNFCVWKPC